SSSRSTRRAPRTTSAPASASAWANATPRPEEAPVTIATFPSRRNRSRTLMSRSRSSGQGRQVWVVRSGVGTTGAPGARHHVVDGVAHLPVEVAGRALPGGDDAGRVAGTAVVDLGLEVDAGDPGEGVH